MSIVDNRFGSIYIITCLANSVVYVGSSVVPSTRREQHFAELRRGVHHSDRMQKCWNKYGENAFSFDVVASAMTRQGMFDAETAVIAQYKKIGEVFNTAMVGNSRLGMKASEETKRKISASLKGRPMSEEHKRKLIALQTGRPKSESCRANISKAKIGTLIPEDVKKKMSLSHLSGKKSRASSGIRGIRIEKRTGKWTARFTIEQKQIHLGTFECLGAAIKARDVAVREAIGS